MKRVGLLFFMLLFFCLATPCFATLLMIEEGSTFTPSGGEEISISGWMDMWKSDDQILNCPECHVQPFHIAFYFDGIDDPWIIDGDLVSTVYDTPPYLGQHYYDLWSEVSSGVGTYGFMHGDLWWTPESIEPWPDHPVIGEYDAIYHGITFNRLDVQVYLSEHMDNPFGPGEFDIQATAIEPVPEPGTILLFGAGLAGLRVFRKRFRKA